MNRKMLLPVFSLLLFTAGCEDFEWGDINRYHEDFQYSYDVKPGVHLYVENLNGSVEITGWEKNSVQITGTKHASEEATLKALKIDIVNSSDSVRIRTIGPSGHRGGYGAKYVIRLPQHAIIEQVDSSNGGVRLEAIDGTARVRTSNGSIKAYRVAGPVELRTSNSSVEVADIPGGAVLSTSNGSIRAEGVKGILDASTTNSSINVTLNDPDPQKPVKLQSSNGSIELTMNGFKDNDIRVATSNSAITLRLPSSAHGMLRAHTSNSSVTCDFDLTVKGGQLNKSWVDGQIGTGGPVLDLSTSNGSIRVQRI
jgi:hypothetical protein